MQFNNTGITFKRENFKISKLIHKVAIIIITLYAVNSGFLAFANEKYSHLYYIITLFVQYSSFFMFLYLLFENRSLKKRNFYLTIIPIIYMLLLLFHTRGGYSGLWLGTFTVLVLFCFLKSDVHAELFFKFYQIIQILNFISVIIYIFYILNINIGFTKVPFYNSETLYYTKYHVFAIYGIRLCGVFNEPGALGTICAFLFVAVDSKVRKSERILLAVTGMMTFSLAFYTIFIGYLGIKYVKRINDPKYFIALIILLLCIVIILNADFQNEELNYYLKRIVSGRSNRTSEKFDLLYKKLWNSWQIFIGLGAGSSKGLDTSSYRNYIYDFGLIGFFMMMFSWILNVWVNVRGHKQCILLAVAFFASVYQRPMALITILGYVVMIGGGEWIKIQEDTCCEISKKKDKKVDEYY